MTLMGDWRGNKDEELELDGIGGVSILVKADVHRSGTTLSPRGTDRVANENLQVSISLLILSKTRPKQKALPRWPSGLATRSSAYPTTSSGTSTPKRRKSPDGELRYSTASG